MSIVQIIAAVIFTLSITAAVFLYVYAYVTRNAKKAQQQQQVTHAEVIWDSPELEDVFMSIRFMTIMRDNDML